MAETPSMKRILDVYYALLAQGVQRYPRPLSQAQSQPSSRNRCLFLIDFGIELVSLELATGQTVSVPPIISRLIERLPWRNQVLLHVIFEHQPKTPQLHPVSEERLASVNEFLSASAADRCVCFGWRTAQVCAAALGIPFSLPGEAFEAIEFIDDNGKRMEFLVLPDVREIEAFPEWRAKVWESLLAFGPTR